MISLKKYRGLRLVKTSFKGVLLGVLIFLIICFAYSDNFNGDAYQKPCENPIEYKIGTLDSRFGVTQEEFKDDISQAVDIWEKSIGRTLFKYNPNGSLTINLIYDTRQKIIQQKQILDDKISQNSDVADSVEQKFSSLQKNYSIAEREYKNQLAQFNQVQDNYNSKVGYWNNKGGAPDTEYYKLQAEENDLLIRENLVEKKRQEINQLSDEINALIDKYNLLIDHINSNVEIINNDGLTGTEFDQGMYISDENGIKIDIYQFDNKIDFISVLTHELGHALGLDHNNNPNSIMYPINEKENLILSPDDIQDLKKECEIE